MEQPETPREQQLGSHFQIQMPACRVYVEWKIDLHSFRFYFDDGGGHRYILDLDKSLLEEQSVAESIQELERKDWKHVLQTRAGQIVRCSDKGFTFRAR